MTSREEMPWWEEAGTTEEEAASMIKEAAGPDAELIDLDELKERVLDESESEPEQAGPVEVDPLDYAEPGEPEQQNQSDGQAAGEAAEDDIDGLLRMLAYLIAQARYKSRERQARFIETWTAEIGPMFEMLRIPQALAAIGWTAGAGLAALPPWIRLALAGAWAAYAFKIADQEARKGVGEGETFMDATTGNHDGNGIRPDGPR